MEVRNRFKGIDLIDRVPDELWTEVRGIVQETGIKTIPMEKKYKKAKWLSEVKIKEEKERYKHLNAEFQRIARRDKKAFISDQCKEIEENNRTGKTRLGVISLETPQQKWASSHLEGRTSWIFSSGGRCSRLTTEILNNH